MINEQGTRLAALREPLDYDKGYDVADSRTGKTLAWRGEFGSASTVAEHLNAAYPTGAIWPAHDTLVHEIAMTRIGGEPEVPLHRLDKGTLRRMIPEAIDGPLDPGRWRPRYAEDA